MLNINTKTFPVEDDHIEYKEKLTKRLKREICAFLNNGLTNHVQYSYIYLGVKDSKKLQGTKCFKVSPKIRQEWEEIINHWITSSFKPVSQAKANIKIYPNNTPFCIKIKSSTDTVFSTRFSHHSSVYIRVGSSSKEADIGTCAHLYILAHRKQLDLGTSPIQNLTFDYTKKVFARHQKAHHHRDTKLRIGGLSSFFTNDNKYTLTALLFSDQNPYYTNTAYYPPHNPSLNFQPYTLHGSIPKQVDDFMKYFTLKFNGVEYVFRGQGPIRDDIYPYPKYAIRESLINLLAHRDYYNPHNPGSVCVFDDKVTMDSPGSVPDNKSKKYVLSHNSDAKNPEVLDMLHRLGYAENYGSGLPRIWDAYKHTHKKPKISLNSGDVEISLPNVLYKKSKHANEYSQSIKSNIIPMSQEDKIIKYLQNYRTINHTIIKQICGIKNSRANRLTRQLCKNHIIKKHGQRKGTYYTLYNK